MKKIKSCRRMPVKNVMKRIPNVNINIEGYKATVRKGKNSVNINFKKKPKKLFDF